MARRFLGTALTCFSVYFTSLAQEQVSFFSDWEVAGFVETESRVSFEGLLDSREFDCLRAIETIPNGFTLLR